MDRKHLQSIAKIRLRDAKALLGRKRWSGAYYLSGYVIECGLKACILRHLGESGAIFGEPTYLKKLADCWTHDLVKLVHLTGLDADFGSARQVDPILDLNWTTTKDWKESSRYDEKTEPEARVLFEAVGDKDHGMLQWIRSRW